MLVIKITVEGLDEAIDYVEGLDSVIPSNIEKQMKVIASSGESAWQGIIPKGRTGRLSGGAKGEAEGMTATFTNAVEYYGFVNDGHSTAKGWTRPWGYQVAKRVSHVEGKEMTKALVQWARGHARQYLLEALKDI